MSDQINLNEILNLEKIDPTTAVNILISVAEISFDKPHLNDVDRMLITKALLCLKSKVDDGKNFMIKVKK